MRNKFPGLAGILLLLLFGYGMPSGCQNPAAEQRPQMATTYPPKDTLRQSFFAARSLRILFPEGLAESARNIKASMQNISVELIQADTFQKEQLAAGAVMLLGSPQSNPAIRLLPEGFALNWTEGKIQLNGKALQASSSVAFLSFHPNPFAPRFPIYIATAYDQAELKQALDRRYAENTSFFGWGSWQYELFEGQQRILMGQYDPQSWVPQPDRQFFLKDNQQLNYRTAVYHFSAPLSMEGEERAEQLAAACLQQAEQLQQSLGLNIYPAAPIPVSVYASCEAKGLQLNDTQPVQILFEESRLALVSSPYFGVAQLGPQNQLLLRKALGKPATLALEEGLAIAQNPEWQFKGFRHWAALLQQGGNLPPLAELLNSNDRPEVSGYVRGAAAASLADFLLNHYGTERFLAAYPTWPSGSGLSADEWEKRWKEHINQYPKARPQARTQPLPYLKGFNFAHEGYSVFNGYGSRFAEAAIREQGRLGANALALVPYSYLRSPHRPAPLPLMRRAGTETDESIIRDAQLSRQLGMAVVLKPQVWLGGGHWPGDVEMTSESDWQAFFSHYYRWMRHYALIAEIYQLDVLCVGVEFAKATQQQSEQWVRLIEQLRSIYGGPVTYAANWGEEFENIDFWQSLDLIGLDCYYPLSQEDRPEPEQLQLAFAKKMDMALKLSRKWKRPLLFTEIGFSSNPAPWKSPHEDGRGQGYDGQAQEMAYAAAMQVFIEKGASCQGMLWWKYPSDLSEGGTGHSGFTPNDKPTEAALPGWFRQLPGR